MGEDGEPKVVADVLQRNQNRILTYVAPIFVVVGVLAAGAYYYSTAEQHRAESDERRRINAARARISFEGRLKDCRINLATGERNGCELDVTSTDPAKRIMSFLVQFPAGFHERTPSYQGTMHGANIDVERGMEYLSARAEPFLRGRTASQNLTVPVPIIIYSTYEFEGQEYSDRSLYYLMYALSYRNPHQVIPISLFQCGRLGEEVPQIDFLIDPWLAPIVGYDREASYSLMFDCDGGAWLTHVDRGRYLALSNVAPGQEGAPRGARNSYAFGPSSLRFQSATNEEYRVRSQIIDVGGPTFRRAPPLRPPPKQSEAPAPKVD